MTKADLIDEVAAISELTKRDSEIVVNTFFGAIVEALNRGDKVELRGFGTFKLRRRNARIGRNPKTGERVDVPAKVVPYFKPGKELRELVNT
jgi:integration host factor subunit beta